MQASVAAVQPTFTASDVMRRHDLRVRRLAAMCLAVAVAVGVIAVVLPKQLGRVSAATMTIEPLDGHLTSYVDPSFGWSITYDRAWVEARTTSAARPDVVDTVRFANFRTALHVTATSSPGAAEQRSAWLRSFPASGVALQIQNVATAMLGPRTRETSFPLRVAKFAPARRLAGGDEPTPMVQVFFGDGIQFEAAVWIGRLASTASEHAIWAAVRSIRFPSLRTGTIWQHRYFVLGPASTYKVDSVTLITAGSLPRGSLQRVGFYLVRSSRAFYVIQRRVLVASPRLVYVVRYDARRRQFVAPGTTLRWSLAGRPVGQVADSPLEVALATVSQDGHVLYAPDVGELSVGGDQIGTVN